jgi:diguanylate cyclase (GGDEF)-like protein
MVDWIEQFFREEWNAIESRLHASAVSGNLETVFREIDSLRSRLAEAIGDQRQFLDKQESIELQARWNREIDGRLRAAIETSIAHRTAALREAARRDELTGLLNRAAFDEQLQDEFERARRYDRRFSLVLFDVDRFKSVNDLHGHLAGDEALAAVARIAQSSLRRSDAVFRYGGDEFAAICPETSRGAIAGAFERLEINFRSWAATAGFAAKIGVSWGIASFPDDVGRTTKDARELIRVADEQLYLCKNEHHNRLAARP